MATKPKGRKKPTSIQDLKDLGIKPVEMERIAKAFGIQTPKAEAKTVKSDVRGRSRTAAGAKVGPKKERLRAKGEESAAPKAPKKAAVKKAAPKKKTITTSKRSNRAPQDAGPEQAYIKRVKVGGTPGQRKRGTGPIVADRKVTKATSLYTGTPGQRRRKSVPKSNVQGPKVVAGGYRRRTPAQRKAASKR